jgi:hypothetical protein
VPRQGRESYARTLPKVAVDAEKQAIFSLLRCNPVVSGARIVIE